MIVRSLLVALVLIGISAPVAALAQQREIVVSESPRDVFVVEDINRYRAHYGELAGWPHLYRYSAEDPFRLTLALAEPALGEEPLEKFTVIVVKEVYREGVTELTRLRPEEVTWEREYEPVGGDAYYRGGSYEAELDEGTYLIEVSSPRNEGKYVLSIGHEKQLGPRSFFSTFKGVYEVKRFFEKPAIAVLQSPFYYIPALLLSLLLVVRYWRRKRNNHA